MARRQTGEVVLKMSPPHSTKAGRMKRLCGGLAIAVPLLAMPAAAQIAPEAVTPTVDKQMWCGVALSITASSASGSGQAEEARRASQRSRRLLAKAAETLVGPAQTAADFQTLVSRYTARVIAPFAAPEFSEADCIVLADES